MPRRYAAAAAAFAATRAVSSAILRHCRQEVAGAYDGCR